MIFFIASFLLLLSAPDVLANGKSYQPYCIDLTIPVELAAPTYPLLIPDLENGYEAISILLQSTKRSAPSNLALILGPPIKFGTTFFTSASYCTSATHSQKPAIVQILIHDLGFDKSYWSFGNASYNYVEATTNAGYATLSYDRLGVGNSEKSDPYNVIQALIEFTVLTRITELLKTGKLGAHPPIPSKIVHVGHSHGSFLTNALRVSRPDFSDSIVLTAFSYSITCQSWFEIATRLYLARENMPEQFEGSSSGFVARGDKYYNQYAFLTFP
ncbi:hypothetical protein K432DRAFT_442615 [Lepidopterella palustris CBS 459.81]|uniref:AB hydrolase-1 domain-containing protein n=1 Tax=Lepidopterella palustris CBS 459.81 TaxID=1314670 RepID=A0A8E2JFX6_9PEZI|nr:hypothetical protein K432DRAFT_442615 [Lepidopterella palustris CBS 459.81]